MHCKFLVQFIVEVPCQCNHSLSDYFHATNTEEQQVTTHVKAKIQFKTSLVK